MASMAVIHWLCIDGICVAQMHRMNPALTLYEAVSNAGFF